ncbi:MAG: hypothetical protein ABI425_02705 [Patescibacteria group bacterium]
MTIQNVTSSAWFGSLEPDQQRQILLSLELLEREKKLSSSFPDYSFVLFPMSKAYEGFLKKFLFSMGLITDEVYRGRHFRIGRALNPDIPLNQRDQWWLYDNVEKSCGPKLSRKLWQAWIECRNHVFHYFPGDLNELSLQKIEQKLQMLIELFESAWQCEIKNKSNKD